ncbi:hypothetical protein J6590_034749 [Homalodisca vitripennis]|nr:hypothetical protein J6590_034749 [Homalodisca vitripennis]
MITKRHTLCRSGNLESSKCANVWTATMACSAQPQRLLFNLALHNIGETFTNPSNQQVHFSQVIGKWKSFEDKLTSVPRDNDNRKIVM